MSHAVESKRIHPSPAALRKLRAYGYALVAGRRERHVRGRSLRKEFHAFAPETFPAL